MPEPAIFEKYFHERANLAEDLYRNGWRNEAVLVATVAVDALATIWNHDHGLSLHGDIRLAKFVQTFSGDPKALLLAVVFLAEDLLRLGPARLRPIAERLLAARHALPSPPKPFEFRTSPLTHFDKDWASLVDEAPQLAQETGVRQLSIRYTYPALLYRLQRCGVAHTLSRGTRTSDFSGAEPDDEISYFPRYLDGGETRPISLKFGLSAVTGWLRATVTNYARDCERREKTPARGFDPNGESLRKLDGLWKQVT